MSLGSGIIQASAWRRLETLLLCISMVTWSLGWILVWISSGSFGRNMWITTTRSFVSAILHHHRRRKPWHYSAEMEEVWRLELGNILAGTAPNIFYCRMPAVLKPVFISNSETITCDSTCLRLVLWMCKIVIRILCLMLYLVLSAVELCVGTGTYEYTSTLICWPLYIYHVVPPSSSCKLAAVLYKVLVLYNSSVKLTFSM